MATQLWIISSSLLAITFAGYTPLDYPHWYAAKTVTPLLSFDATYSSTAPKSTAWTLGSAASNTSKGILLTSSPPNATQGFVTSSAKTTTSTWRAEIHLNLNFTGNGGPCPLFGFMLIDGSSAPVLNANNTITNFKGLAVWFDICPGGSVHAFFSTSLVPLYDPSTNSTLTQCSPCQMSSPVPANLSIVLESVFDRLSVALMPQTYPVFPSTCFSNADISGFTTMAVISPLTIQIVALNGYNAAINVDVFSYIQLGNTYYIMPSCGTGSTLPKLIPDIPDASLASNFKLNYDYTLSFCNSSSFQYSTVQKATTLNVTSPGTVTLMPAIKNAEGSILSPTSIAPGSTAFRAEIIFRFPSTFSAAWPSSFLYIILANSLYLPLSANNMISTSSIQNFQGFMIVLEIGNNAVSNHSLYYSTVLDPNYLLNASTQAVDCPASQVSGLKGPALTNSSGGFFSKTFSIGIVLYHDQISVTVFADSNVHPMPQFLYSNYPMPGIGSAIAGMNASLQIIQQNGANNASFSVQEARVYTDAAPITTTSSSTTTSSTTSTTSPPKTTASQPSTDKAIAEILSYTSSETGFPVPQLCKGNAVVLVTLADILKCPYVLPDIRAPNEYNTTAVYATLSIDRLLDVSDVDETISISASLYLQWGVFICSANYTAAGANIERILVAQPSAVWHPGLAFANSSNDVYMTDSHYGEDMQILYLPTAINRTLYFYWSRMGIYTAKCALNLRNFPFDEQKCDFTFEVKEPDEFVNFAGIYLRGPAMVANSNWILLDSSSHVGTSPSPVIRNGMSSYVQFKLTFARNPLYYVYNLLCPCYILVGLVLASFLMPPDKPDRPVLVCTIMLAFVVSQADILKEIPRTPQRVFLSEYVLLFAGLTALVTIYDMVTCTFTLYAPLVALEPVTLFCDRCCKLKTVRAFDVVAFLIAVDFLIVIHIYAATVVF